MNKIACSFFFYFCFTEALVSLSNTLRVEEEGEGLVHSDRCIEPFSIAVDVPRIGGTFSFSCDLFMATVSFQPQRRRPSPFCKATF